MKVYIQATEQFMPYNVNTFSAMLGFQQMGVETVLFSSKEELLNVEKENIVVGGVGRVKGFLEERGIRISDIDYPESLNQYYGRRIWKSSVKELLENKYKADIFVKPLLGKQFNGFVYRDFNDLIGKVSPNQNVDIYCSEVLDIKAEWRCFVRYGEILDIKRYKGELGIIYDYKRVKEMVAAYKDAPRGYALDIGVTSDNQTVIIEINDGYSLGCYGLDPLLYAKLLSARWAEVTKTEDECYF